MLSEAHHECQICSEKKNLDVHHKNYNHLWNEGYSDLLVLCRDCHKRCAHKLGGEKKSFIKSMLGALLWRSSKKKITNGPETLPDLDEISKRLHADNRPGCRKAI
jgi:uncharacterized protein YlaI